jgi:hypothetical protein
MRRAGSAVNWSTVAAEAFEQKLEELARTNGLATDGESTGKDKNPGVAETTRKMEDPRVVREREISRGRENGRRWAEAKAGADWFKKLDAVSARLDILFRDGELSEEGRIVLTPLLEDLFLRFVGKKDWSRQIWLWSRYDSVQTDFPDPGSGPPFIYGFLQGTQEIWEQVKSRAQVK